MTLDRPDRRNPLSLEMMREATAAIRDLGRDPTCGVVVLTGSGPA
ncbi:enoyl-CoA hydratase-related protein, partial [Dietzia sp. UBA5065]